MAIGWCLAATGRWAVGAAGGYRAVQSIQLIKSDREAGPELRPASLHPPRALCSWALAPLTVPRRPFVQICPT
eukprot:SAG25_NODE_6905_length_520_cov_0.584323_1_plen_73_part_00